METKRITVNLVVVDPESIDDYIAFHFAEAAANVLTIDALDPQAMIPEYKICAVKIEPATAAELEQTLQTA